MLPMVRPRPPRGVVVGLAVAGGVTGAGLVALRISPWPSVWLIRRAFSLGGRRDARRIADQVIPPVAAITDLAYRDDDPDATLDVYQPQDGRQSVSRATVVWVHGGGFVAGDKSDVAGYLRLLAAEGFTTVAINYSVAPRYRYPLPVRQLGDALRFLQREAPGLGIDPDRIVLAGDSAGAQIAAQVAAVVAEPDYAQALGLDPPLRPDQLRGVVLFCGPYDVDLTHDARGLAQWAIQTFVWSYSGVRRLTPQMQVEDLFSVARHVTSRYPPSFVSVGNADFLAAHSHRLAEQLTAAGAEVDTLFFPSNHEPPLHHEYQFDLGRPEAAAALARVVGFLRRVTG